MNSKPQLGKIEAVGARHVWADEAADFTPWLAEEKNIALLGEALGLELEVESTEVAVGPYSADILAKDTGTGRFVVIENQLAKTNHDHLGKAVTYASALDATAVVWIAPEFTEEHQKALEWLNDHTTEDLAFYAVLLEVWRIENSPPAVRFNVISRPAGAARKAAVTRAEHFNRRQETAIRFTGPASARSSWKRRSCLRHTQLVHNTGSISRSVERTSTFRPSPIPVITASAFAFTSVTMWRRRHFRNSWNNGRISKGTSARS